MQELEIDKEQELKEIQRSYKQLVKIMSPRMKPGDEKRLERAFEVAAEAHKDQRRKSGIAYIFHPLEVAKIVAGEIGLGTTSVMCALLHDTVEDTELTFDDIRREFGDEVVKIIDGLTKISQISSRTESIQAENYRKILLTLSDDIRVILIKLADRLHNMRTLDTMSRKNQLKISSETIYLYAPLAHRLGLYSIKSEMEDLSMKYTEREKYKEIAGLLNTTKRGRNKFISEFIKPIQEDLEKVGLKANVFGRPKSIFSIWNKMKKKEVSFEDVYDKFAIRVIIDSPVEREKEDCWRAYSIITDQYRPSPNRLRDWLSHPKANGYESLHTTVMGSKGKWVEVQIRSKRMDEIAEKGLAAHYKYKEGASNENKNKADEIIENWLMQVREYLKSPETNPLDFIEDFKLQLYTKEIYTFTPKGELKVLPVGATALDFAYHIHTGVGDTCIGAKVNNKLVSISHVLQNGDQVEIITSKKQKPSESWLSIVTTSRAQSKIKNSLKEEKKLVAENGKEILERKLKGLKVPLTHENLQVLINYFNSQSALDLYYNFAVHKLNPQRLKELSINGQKLEIPKHDKQPIEIDEFTVFKKTKLDKNAELVIFGESSNQFPFEFAKCCNPIPGDDVVGFISINGVVKIHRTNCKNVINLMSKYGYRIIKASWTPNEASDFLMEIGINGIDELGVLNKITHIISDEMEVNMQSMSVESNNGIYEGKLKIYVKNQQQLQSLIDRLKAIEGVTGVSRIE
ncbi:MAG: bifunctional (p)ppGpp synthetase/guanosine-3',5'-bis(diphosphate) 3'-pyrophosphohydrolase [Chitinophagales bacterium]|nr:bifunctional (p)ppGpp synthetase/guanosine-3',5'-bis(diphosphate) 3'-pyrophosphohydrolase [Chitinophagales bacterium]